MPDYKTKQKSVITDFLKENGDGHITVDEIVEKLQSSGEGVGRSTVYRCLERLENEGYVRKYISDGKKSCCYQYVGNGECKEHFHLQCEKCGKLIHIECDALDSLNEHIKTEHGFTVNALKTVLYGVCEECKDK